MSKNVLKNVSVYIAIDQLRLDDPDSAADPSSVSEPTVTKHCHF